MPDAQARLRLRDRSAVLACIRASELTASTYATSSSVEDNRWRWAASWPVPATTMLAAAEGVLPIRCAIHR